MLKPLIGIISTSILVGCGGDKYQLQREPFSTEKEAAVNFFKSNTLVLKNLTTTQEMLGYVLRCRDTYYHTTPLIGGLVNVRSYNDTSIKGCNIVAGLHTHPRQPQGWTVDFFSPEDVKTSHHWNSYLLSQENCNLRFGSKLTDRDGVLLGKIENCK